MLPGFARQTVTVRRPAVVDDHGTSVPDWRTATTHDVRGCSWQPLTSAEVTENREARLGAVRLLLPPGADLETTDRVADPRGRREFAVVGEVLDIDSPTGGLSHREALLNRWEG